VFPAEFEVKRVELSCEAEQQPPVKCPDFTNIMETLAIDKKIEEDDETILEDIMMWFGLVHTRSLK
jgi:hypothetical protein